MPTRLGNLLDDLMRRSLRMASVVEDTIQKACDSVNSLDQELARSLIEGDEEIDQEEVAIENETLRLMTLFQPMGLTMRRLCTILKVNGDLERIADCAVNMAERAYHLDPQATENARLELQKIQPVVRGMVHEAIHAYATGDQTAARKIRSKDEIIDAFYAQFIRKIVSEGAGSPENLASHLDILSIAKNLERIADHTTNIAEDVIYMATGIIVRHRDGANGTEEEDKNGIKP